MWPNVEFRFTGGRFAKSTTQSFIENRFEWPPGLSREFCNAFGKIVFEGKSGPHKVIMMPGFNDVKMPLAHGSAVDLRD